LIHHKVPVWVKATIAVERLGRYELGPVGPDLAGSPPKLNLKKGGLIMKARFVVLLVIMAALASPNALAQTVKYSVVGTGSFAFCFNAAFTALLACTDPAAVAGPVTDLEVGNGERNAQGGCESRVVTYAALPPLTVPPLVEKLTVVYQITNYDPSTGAGDANFSNYTGGSCNGVNFDSSGATLDSTNTDHFQDSENGNRRDFVITASSSPTTGTFSLHRVERTLVSTK
jgi:hypothetical protein